MCGLNGYDGYGWKGIAMFALNVAEETQLARQVLVEVVLFALVAVVAVILA